ncbi:MAG TPA: helix-turn-helix domain-containing protein [Thermoanaerobaculia bacterium]|nr:helix-turn-helix domain-containing protein [Thermoanaerobaculia bacterium]
MGEQHPMDVAQALRLVRSRRGWSQEQWADEAGLSEKTVWRAEEGRKTPRRKTVVRLLRAAKVPLPLFDAQVELLGAMRAADEGLERSDPGSSDVADVAMAAVRAGAAGRLASLPAPDPWDKGWPPRPEDHLRADQLWNRFARRDPEHQWRLVRGSRAYRIWSFCVRLCDESVAAAADDPAEALRLAEIALYIAQRVSGTASWRARLQAYAWPHAGNARRVGNDLDRAKQAFEEARRLRKHFALDDPRLLDEGRAFDLEASLLREERRFTEAIERLDRALELSPAESEGRILLNKVSILEQAGEPEKALETLWRAAPLVERKGDPNQLFALRFNLGVNLCHLQRTEEAEALLDEIRTLAAGLGKRLHNVRLRWLEARVAAGLGRTAEAVATIDEVCAAFLDLDLPYDAALAGLNLALYWLEQGSTGPVQALAASLERIFDAQGIRREALASLGLFCEAARTEAATIELVRQVKEEIERAGRR